MSTRATYSFLDNQYENAMSNTCVYIHYDGYPEGAALYFYKTFIKPSKGNLATRFIRANEHAEITKGHTVHADTDYRYYVSGNDLTASVLAYRMDSQKKKELIFMGSMKEFINQHNGCIQDFSPFKQIRVGYSNKELNVELARKEINSLMHNLKAWEVGLVGTSNWNNCVDDIMRITDVFPELMNEEIERYVNMAGE